MRFAIPGLLFAAACGRIAFDPLGADAATDGAVSIDGKAAAIAWVRAFVGHADNGTHSFAAQAQLAGDAVLVHLNCANNSAPTGVVLSAPGWTFYPIGPLTGSVSASQWAASFGAIAPDTAPATFTVTWNGTSCTGGTADLGDEFSGNSTTMGSAIFDGHAEASGSANCAVTVTTGSANDAVWAACSAGAVQAVGGGYVKGADDQNRDWSEYRVTTDPAGTAELATFSSSGGFVITAVTIRGPL